MRVAEETHFGWYGTSFNSNILKDSKEYFEKKFHCKLTHLDLSDNEFSTNVNINDPKIVQFNYLRQLVEFTPTLTHLNFSFARFNKYFVDMIVNALSFQNAIKSLNLEGCSMNGDWVRTLMFAFSKEKDSKETPKEKLINQNMHLELLNLGKNKFGYSGIESISAMLKENKTLKVLNLFSNLFDVNGARRLKDALEINSTLEVIDISYNRIKDHGFSNVVEGLLKNPNSKIRFLASRYNFIKTQCMVKNLEKLLNSENSKIETLELKNNSIEEKALHNLHKDIFLKGNRKANIDIFETLHFLQPEKIERTVWISPLAYTETQRNILNTINEADRKTVQEDESRLGIPLFISLKRGRMLGEKKTNTTLDAFVEFIHPNSANRFLKIASVKGFFVSGKKMRVYKAGTKPERLLLKKRRGAECRKR